MLPKQDDLQEETPSAEIAEIEETSVIAEGEETAETVEEQPEPETEPEPEETETTNQEDEPQWMKAQKDLFDRIEALERQNQSPQNLPSSPPPNSRLAHRLERRRQRALRKHRNRSKEH